MCHMRRRIHVSYLSPKTVLSYNNERKYAFEYVVNDNMDLNML